MAEGQHSYHDSVMNPFVCCRSHDPLCVCSGYRHVYLEGMEEASIFVHVAVNDITGKVGTTEDAQTIVIILQ